MALPSAHTGPSTAHSRPKCLHLPAIGSVVMANFHTLLASFSQPLPSGREKKQSEGSGDLVLLQNW